MEDQRPLIWDQRPLIWDQSPLIWRTVRIRLNSAERSLANKLGSLDPFPPPDDAISNPEYTPNAYQLPSNAIQETPKAFQVPPDAFYVP